MYDMLSIAITKLYWKIPDTSIHVYVFGFDFAPKKCSLGR